MNDFVSNTQYADSHASEIQSILARLPVPIVVSLKDVKVADHQRDTKEATDYVIRSVERCVAARIRRPEIRFRDFTLRAYVPFCREVEIDKVRGGWCDFYLYAWTGEAECISEWIWVDMARFRSCGLAFAERRLIPNRDGTGFYSYSLKELRSNDCILAEQKPQPVRVGPVQPTLF